MIAGMDLMMLGSIFVSGVVAVLIGFVWYLPAVFGTAWMRLLNVSPEMAESGKKKMPLMALFGLLSAMLVAYVMTYVNAAWGFTTWSGGIQLGFWCWMGFVAPTMLSQVLWEHRPFKLYLIDALYWLVSFLVIAQIIVFTYGISSSLYFTSSTTDTSAVMYEGE